MHICIQFYTTHGDNDTFRKFQSPNQAFDGLPDHLKDCVLLFRPFRKAFLQNVSNLNSDLVLGENVNLRVRRIYANIYEWSKYWWLKLINTWITIVQAGKKYKLLKASAESQAYVHRTYMHKTIEMISATCFVNKIMIVHYS